MSFDKHVSSCDHHKNQVTEHFYNLRKLSPIPLQLPLHIHRQL